MSSSFGDPNSSNMTTVGGVPPTPGAGSAAPASSAAAETAAKEKAPWLGLVPILAGLADILGFFNKLPLNGKWNILIVAVVSLFLFVLAIVTLLKWRSNNNTTNAASVVTFVVAGSGSIYFALGFFVLAFSNSPPIRGYPAAETTAQRHEGVLELKNAKRTNDTLYLTSELTFSEEADFAQVDIVVPVDSQSQVKSLNVAPTRPPGVTVNTRLRRKVFLDGFYLEPVHPTTKVSVNIELALLEKSTAPAQLNVFYKYWRKDYQWRLEAWFHGRYA